MLFLYRFELMGHDAAAMLPGQPPIESARLPANNYLTLLTNWEQPVTLAADTGALVFLPKYSRGGQVWKFEPAEVQHEGLRLDGEKAAGDLVVSLPLGHPLSQIFAGDPQGFQLWLTVSSMESPTAAPLRFFTGMVAGAEFDEYRCTFTLQPLEKVLERQTLTALHPRDCPHSLFNQSTCRVKPNASVAYSVGGVNRTYFKYREDGNVGALSADGLVLTVPEAANRPDGFFNGGLVVVGGSYGAGGIEGAGLTRAQVEAGLASVGALEYRVDAGYRRTVRSHVGSQLTLQAPLPAADYTAVYTKRVTIFSGCDGRESTCAGTYQNIKFYGGYPTIPLKDPQQVGLMEAR